MQVAKVKDTFNSAKLPLSKWSSNNEEVLKFIKSEDKITAFGDNKSSWKILRLLYFPHEDEFGINIKKINNIKFIKRGLLGEAAKLYDPIGFILPVVMQFRMLL